jgi:hypothetical protein
MTDQTDKEKYICLNCFAIGELSSTLRCLSCDSDVVASCESVKNITPRAESRRLGALSATAISKRHWYHFECNGFETVVSYTKASSFEEAIQYAKSANCEWYMSSSLCPTLNELGLMKPKLLNHAEYIQWCEKLWPLTDSLKEEPQTTTGG